MDVQPFGSTTIDFETAVYIDGKATIRLDLFIFKGMASASAWTLNHLGKGFGAASQIGILWDTSGQRCQNGRSNTLAYSNNMEGFGGWRWYLTKKKKKNSTDGARQTRSGCAARRFIGRGWPLIVSPKEFARLVAHLNLRSIISNMNRTDPAVQ